MSFHSVGNFIIPTDFHSIIFQRGRAQPPTRLCLTGHQGFDQPNHSGWIWSWPQSVTVTGGEGFFGGNDPQDYVQVAIFRLVMYYHSAWYADRMMISNKHSWRKLQDLMIEPLLPHVFQLVKPQNARAPEDPHVPFLMVKTPHVWCRCSIFDEIWLMVSNICYFPY